MAQNTKQRMIEAAATSLRTRGLAATSFTDVLAASGAARGAIYHHFPGGKDDLAEQAIDWSSQQVRAELEGLGTSDPHTLVQEFIQRIQPIVVQASNGVGCAIAVVAGEASSGNPALAAAAAAALASWIDVLEARLRQSGVASGRDRAIAQFLIAFLEGSLVLARASRSVDGFDAAVPMLTRLFAPGRLD